jgi:RNA polymerase sigma-70 factor (family 1)
MHYSTEEERQIITEMSSGSAEAFRLLYEQYHRGLYRYALRFLKSTDLAQDAVQDTFVKIWEKRCNLLGVQHLKAFMYTVCRNQILDLMARASREESVRQEIILSLRLTQEAGEETAQPAYEALVETAIAKLPPQRQQIFRLCRLQGKSYDEAAQELGISRSTVSDHLVKATKFLREDLSASVDFSLLLVLMPALFAL